MPEIGVNARPKAKPGKHNMTLMGVKAFIGPNKFAKKEDGTPDPDALREQFIWDLESEEVNEFGEPLTYSVFTNTTFGNAKAGLTKFLTLILAHEFKGLSKDERIAKVNHLNTDNLIGTRYFVTLREQESTGGGTYVGHTDIEPMLDKKGKIVRVLVDATKVAPAPAKAPALKKGEVPV